MNHANRVSVVAPSSDKEYEDASNKKDAEIRKKVADANHAYDTKTKKGKDQGKYKSSSTKK